MTSLAWLIPAALALGGLGLAAFLWSLRTGQYEDLDGAAWRALQDDQGRPLGETHEGKPEPGKQETGQPSDPNPADRA